MLLTKLPDKINLIEHPYIRHMIRKLRKDDVIDNHIIYTAEELSLKIGKSKSWLAQIENGRLKSIIKSDLVGLMLILLSNYSKENIEDEIISAMEYYEQDYQEILKYNMSEEPISKDTFIKREMASTIFTLKESVFNLIDELETDDKQKLVDTFKNLNKNINHNLTLTSIISNLPIHAVNTSDKNSQAMKDFISDVNIAFTKYLSSTLNNNF